MVEGEGRGPAPLDKAQHLPRCSSLSVGLPAKPQLVNPFHTLFCCWQASVHLHRFRKASFVCVNYQYGHEMRSDGMEET